MAHTTLTGGLVGAMVGIQGISEHFSKGPTMSDQYLDLAGQIAKFAIGEPDHDFAAYNPNVDALPHSADRHSDAEKRG